MSNWHHEAERWKNKQHVADIHSEANLQAVAIQKHVQVASTAMKIRATKHFTNTPNND